MGAYEDQVRAALARQLSAPPTPEPAPAPPPGVMVIPPVDIVSKRQGAPPKAPPPPTFELGVNDTLGDRGAALKAAARAGGFKIPIGADPVMGGGPETITLPNGQKGTILGLSAPPLPPKGAAPPERADTSELVSFSAPTKAAPPRFGGGGAPTKIPAHDVPLVSPETMADFDRAQAMHERAIRDREKAGVEAADAQADTMHGLAREAEQQQQAAAAREAKQAATMKDYAGRAEELTQHALSQKIDSGRLWANASTGQKIGTWIGLAIGGFYQGFTGRNNPAQDAIDKAIDRDIAEQKSHIEGAWRGAEASRGLYHDALQRFGDERAASLATHQAYLAKAEMLLKEQAAQTRSAEQKANAEDALAGLAEKRAELDTKLKRYVQETVMGGGAAPGNAPDLESARLVTMPDGTRVYAASHEEGRSLRTQAGSVNEISGLLDEAVKLRESPKAFLPGTEEHARLTNINGQLKVAGKNAAQLGALSGPDMGLLEEQYGNVTSIKPGTSAQLKSAKEHVLKSFKQNVAAQGAPVVQPGWALDKKGNAKQTGTLTGETYAPKAAPTGGPAPSFKAAQ